MPEPIIAVERVTKQVADATGTLTILHEVDFQLVARESVAIVGASGSGKSTLLSILAGLDVPSSGTVKLAGIDLFAMDEDARAALRAERVGFVFQSFQLLPRATALQNVELPLVYRGMPRTKRRREAREALAKVGLADRSAHRPHELSGGQRQRVAIARALVGAPTLLLADEPTGNLDTATEREIMALFDELHAKGHTIVVVTHEPSVAAVCPRAIRLAEGRVAADGPGREVAARVVTEAGHA